MLCICIDDNLWLYLCVCACTHICVCQPWLSVIIVCTFLVSYTNHQMDCLLQIMEVKGLYYIVAPDFWKHNYWKSSLWTFFIKTVFMDEQWIILCISNHLCKKGIYIYIIHIDERRKKMWIIWYMFQWFDAFLDPIPFLLQ